MSAAPAISSEWIKFRTVRSTVYALAVTIVLCVGIGALVSFAERSQWPKTNFQDRALFDPVATSLSGFFLAEIAVGVIGVLIISSEYSSGSIRSTLAAMPLRINVLAAKSAVLFVTALVVGEACSFISFFVGQAIMGSVLPPATLATPGALRAVVLAGLSLALLALLALGIGTMLRHTAGAITAYVAVLLVALLIVTALPSSWNVHIFKFLPAVLSTAMQSSHTSSDQFHSFTPWVSTLVLGAYALAALIAGGVLLVRRDA